MLLRHKRSHSEIVDTPTESFVQKPKHEPSIHAHPKHLYKRKRLVLIASLAGCLVIVGGGFAYWRLVIWQPAVIDPFTAALQASAQIPLYYPTQIPKGYAIDTKSVTVPTSGVVVFNIDGPKGQKIYMSQEARPATFDIGGFYTKFTDLKEISEGTGSIASGLINGNQTKIASRLTPKTWILTNTNTSVSVDQLVVMLKSLTLNY